MSETSGLEGVVAAKTDLSLVDGERGVLVFRGHFAGDLAVSKTYEEVAHLLWYGKLPTEAELARLKQDMAVHRILPDFVKRIVEQLPTETDMMRVMMTAVAALEGDAAWPPTHNQAIRVTALLPTVVAYRQALLTGMTPVDPDPSLSHTANYLYMLTGVRPSDHHVRALEAYLVITMEHGMNASTFTGRVVTSTQSDLFSAVCGALGSMKGPLHGGAPSGVMDMLEAIGTIDNAEPWIRAQLEQGARLMGFGHRVYKTIDPRGLALRAVVKEMSSQDPWFDLASGVEATAIRLLDEYKPGRRLYTNVEYWAAAVLRSVGLPRTLFTPTFSISRVVGWTAHVLEQSINNRIIRPQSEYVGPMPE